MMRFSGKNDQFELHPALASFVAALSDFPQILPAPSTMLALPQTTCFAPLLVSQRAYPDNKSGRQYCLLGPLLPLLFWPAFDKPPVGLPLLTVTLSDEQVQAALTAELLRHAMLFPKGSITELTRLTLNACLSPTARRHLFGRQKKISQEQFAQLLGLDRAQLAYQSQRLKLQPDRENSSGEPEPAFFKEWLAEHAD